MERKYNQIYLKITENEYDIVGHIAYALYKKHKIEFIENFRKQNNCNPTEEDLQSFHESSSLDSSIQRFRLEAENILSLFVDELFKNEISEIEEKLKENQLSNFKEAVKPLVPSGFVSFVKSVFQNVISNIVTIVLLGLFIFILWANQISTTTVIERIFHIKIASEDTVKVNQSPLPQPTIKIDTIMNSNIPDKDKSKHLVKKKRKYH